MNVECIDECTYKLELNLDELMMLKAIHQDNIGDIDDTLCRIVRDSLGNKYDSIK